MNFDLLFKLLSVVLIFTAGPLIVILIATQDDNGL